MLRREFVITSILSLPAFACTPSRRLTASGSKALVIKAGLSRFGIATPFKGVNPNDLKLSTKDTAGKLSAFWYKGAERTGPSYHSHTHQDEMFYVLDGTYVFQVGDEKATLRKGDLIFLPRNIPHTWVQTSDSGEMFYFLQPAGKMEEFFLFMTQSGSKLTKEEKSKANNDFGIVNHGPGLSASEKYDIIESVSKGFIVRNKNGRFGEKTVLNGKSTNDIKVSGKDTGGELSIFEYNGKEKGGPPMHIHPNQDEIFYISSGNYLFQCGQEQFVLTKGDMIFLPRGVAHTWAQLTDEGQMLFFFQPCGKMEDFFRAISNGSPKPESYDPFKAHDMSIVGPPLAFS